MTPLTDEQIETRLQVLATGMPTTAAAKECGVGYGTLYRWINREGLQNMLGAHQRRMRLCHEFGTVDGESWEEVGRRLGISPRWACRLAGQYAEHHIRRKQAV